MARTLSIVKVLPSAGPGVPGRVVVAGNLVSSFQGKFWRQNTSPFTTTAFYLTRPANTTEIAATTFDISGNPSYNGRYTVFTPKSGDLQSSVYNSTTNETTIAVNEVVGPVVNAGDDTIGTISNISTFLIRFEEASGSQDLIVPPAVQITNRPLDIIGRNGTPWAESYTQNFVDLAQNFAGSEPTQPFFGQTWFDKANSAFKLRINNAWVTLASTTPGANSTFRFAKTSAATTWVINHNLNLVAPYVALIQAFVVVDGEYKMILPSDVAFTDANNLTITFSQPQTGIVLIRP